MTTPAGARECKVCGLPHAEVDFRRVRNNARGRWYTLGFCVYCEREKQRKYTGPRGRPHWYPPAERKLMHDRRREAGAARVLRREIDRLKARLETHRRKVAAIDAELKRLRGR